MRLAYSKTALEALEGIPARIRKALYKQAGFLLAPLAPREKVRRSRDKWQARVTKSWRFYFKIIGDTYFIEDITPHPKK